MKNNIISFLKVSKKHNLIILVMLLLSALYSTVLAQCDVANFTVSSVTGTCPTDNQVVVTIPGATTCAGVQATLLQGATTVQGPVTLPANGQYTFTNVSVGAYQVTLTQGANTYGPKNITVTTNYVQLSYSFTVTAPTCNPTGNQFVSNATITATIPAGVGKAPFTYTLVSPSAGTLTSGSTSSRSYTFTGLGNNELEALTIVDACGTSVTQNPRTGSNTSVYADLLQAYFLRSCAAAPGNCNSFTLALRLRNAKMCYNLTSPCPFHSASFSTDGGTTWIPMTSEIYQTQPYLWHAVFGAGYAGFTTSATFTSGQVIKIRASDGCNEIIQDYTVPTPNNNFLNLTQLSRAINCVPRYVVFLNDEPAAQVVGGVNTMYYRQFCDGNTTVEVLKESPAGSGIYVQETILYNQNINIPTPITFTMNGPAQTHGMLRQYGVEVAGPGKYRLVVSDGCHSVTRDITMVLNEPIPTLYSVGNANKSIYSGTGAVRVINLKANEPYTFTINTVPAGQTRTVNSGPFSYANANPYNITFPQSFNYQEASTSVDFTDLPPGDYQITVTDGCNNSTVFNKTITDLAGYNPVITKTLSCINSNKIELTLNPNAFTLEFVQAISLVYNNNGVPGSTVGGGVSITPSQVLSGSYGTVTVNNVPSGSYFIKFNIPGTSVTHRAMFSPFFGSVVANHASQRILYIPVDIPAVQSVNFSLTQGMCGATGYIGIALKSPDYNNYIYPLTYRIYNAAGYFPGVSIPLQTITAANSSQNSAVFNGLTPGDYVVVVNDQCSSATQNFTLNGAPLTPMFASTPANPVCEVTPVTLYVANISAAAYDFVWKDQAGNTLGALPTLTVTPTPGTTTYSVDFTLKSSVCIGGTTQTLNGSVEVKQTPVSGSIGSNQSICYNTIPTPLTSIVNGSGGAGTISYMWEKFATGDAVWTTIPGATGATYIPGVLTVTTSYRRTVLMDYGGGLICNSQPTTPVIITVEPTPSFTASATSLSSCSGAIVSVSFTPSPNATVYWGNSLGGTGAGNISQQLTNNTTLPLTVTYTAYAQTALGCTSPTQTITVTLNPTPEVIPSVCEQTICSGQIANITFATTLGATVNWTADDGTNGTGNISEVKTNNTAAPITITYSITGVASNGCSSQPQNCQVVVNHEVTATISAQTPETCQGNLNGSVIVEAVTGTAPFTYSIDGDTFTGSGNFSGLAAGSYTVSVLDAMNCLFSVPLTIDLNDTEPPIISICPVTRNIAGCDLNALTDPSVNSMASPSSYPEFSGSINQGVVTDNCGIQSIMYADYDITGSCPIVINRTWFVSDASGNTSSCTQIITIDDTTRPTISCPENITRNAMLGECERLVNYTSPLGTDNCRDALTTQIAGLPSGSLFPIGNTTNTFQTTDACGNTATCGFTVTIRDLQIPIFSNCPSDTIIYLAPGVCNTVFNYPTPLASDNCSGLVTIQTTGLASGSVFPIGVTTITFVATDPSGNSASCRFHVIVVDSDAPVITNCASLLPITVNNMADIPAPDPGLLTATDNCDGNIDIQVHDEYLIGCGAPDLTPVIMMPKSINNGDTITFVGIIKNIGTAPSSNPVKVFNPNDLRFTNMTFDNSISKIPVHNGAVSNGIYSYDLKYVPVSNNDFSFTIDGMHNIFTYNGSIPGNSEVQFTYKAVFNSPFSRGSINHTLQIINDPLETNLPNNSTSFNTFFNSNYSEQYSSLLYGYVPSYTNPPPPADCYCITGSLVLKRVYAAIDSSGNMSSCEQTITVLDTVSPLPDITSLPNVTGICSVTVSPPTASDNCDGTIKATTSDPLSYSLPGTYSITWTYTDQAGNTSIQVQTVVISVPPTPTISASITQPTCAVATGSLTISNYDLFYTYDVSPSISVSMSGAIITAPAGTYTLSASGGPSCVSLPSAPMVINPQPPSPVVNLGAVPPVCINNPQVQLSASPQGGIYSGPGVNSSGLFTTAIAGLGTHTITYTYTNALGCSNTATTQVQVVASPILNLSAGSQTICSGTSATVSITGNNGASVNWFSNVFGITGIGNPFTTSILTNSGNTPLPILFTAIATSGICSDNETTTVTVLPEPRVIIIPINSEVCYYEKLSCTITSVLPGTTINWELINDATDAIVATGTGLDNITLFNTTFPVSSYTLRATGTKDGCTSGVISLPLTVN